MTDIESLARMAMDKLEQDELRSECFVKIMRFAWDNQDFAAKLRGQSAPAFGTAAYVERMAKRYVHGLKPKPLPKPGTKPDPALALVMTHGYDVSEDEIHTQIEGHRWAMVAENVVGDLLERYIDSELLDDDWVWCAGEVLRSIDFIRECKEGSNVKWESLQIKNRDNSENSSSSAIRSGTAIAKWHRTIARSGETRWDQFPVSSVDLVFSEEGFRKFIVEYVSERRDHE